MPPRVYAGSLPTQFPAVTLVNADGSDFTTTTSVEDTPGISFGILVGNLDAALTANMAYYARVSLPARFNPNRIRFNVASASGNFDTGIYADDGTGLAPGTRLVSTGSTPVPAAGRILQTITAVTLDPGVYWLTFAVDNGTATFTIPPPRMGRIVGSRSQTAAFPLPATAAVNGNVESGICIAMERA